MSDDQRRYWFLAKRYGWGWGPPVTWQGWVVVIAWFAILLTVSPWLVTHDWRWFPIFIVSMVTALITIAYLKGEPPRWRWGDD